MACEKSGELMMKYMDGLLDDFENMNLEKHIQCCETCREDFAVYKEMLEGFNHNNMEIIEAPEGFVEAVMVAVDGINLYFPKKVRDKGKILDSLIFAAWGLLVGILVAGIMLFLYQEQIFAWLHANGLSALAQGIYPFAIFTTNFADTLGYYTSNASHWISINVGNYAFVFLLAFVALVIVQFYISPKYAKTGKKRS